MVNIFAIYEHFSNTLSHISHMFSQQLYHNTVSSKELISDNY
jgi:hypothetical protein